MHAIPERRERVVSAWKLNSDGRTFLSALREADSLVSPAVNESAGIDLLDPPEQFSSDENSKQLPNEDLLNVNEKGERDGYYESLKEYTDGAFRSVRNQEGWRKRGTPSKKSMDQKANTVEIVKRNGRYREGMDTFIQPTDGRRTRPDTACVLGGPILTDKSTLYRICINQTGQ